LTDYQEVRTTKHEPGQEQRATTFKITQVIWLLLGILEALLALRVVFRLVGVNATNSFATLLYAITGFFVAPFASLAGAPSAGNIVLEVSSLIAMFVYFLIAWALERIAFVIFYRSNGPMTTKQTIETDHTSQQVPLEIHRTSSSVNSPAAVSKRNQTSADESTHPHTPGLV
jgi:hypothetical protein